MLNDTLINIKNIQNGSVNMVYDYKNNYINLQIENVGLSLGIIYLTYLIIFGAFKEVDPYRKFVDKYKDNVVDLKNKLSFLKKLKADTSKKINIFRLLNNNSLEHALS